MVSLACSNTEIVCALGCAEMLVGVDDHSDHPPEVVRALPRVGPDLGVKAAGGIRTYADAMTMIGAGATRIGASAGRHILAGASL